MSNEYSFIENDNYKNGSVLDSTVQVEDGVVWNQEEIQVSLSYSNDSNDTLTENPSESFLTAHEASNDTQYFSVLETTNEAVLNDLSDITATEADTSEVADEQPNINSICTIGGQPDIYRIEGSNDLYAFEVAYDEEGNVQRFRYRLRLNESGEYECVPESIELLPLENESEGEPLHVSPAEIPQEEQEDDSQLQRTVKVFVKQEFPQESILPDLLDIPDVSNPAEDSNDELQVNEDELESSGEEDTVVKNTESKSGILQHGLLSINKIEGVRHYKSEESNSAFEETLFEHANNHDLSTSPSDDLHSSIHNDEVHDSDNFKQACAISSQNANDSEDTDTATEHGHSYDQLFVDENQQPLQETFTKDVASSLDRNVEKPFTPESDDNSHEVDENRRSEDSEAEEHFEGDGINNVEYLRGDINENESDTDDYQIVDGVHVTADTEEPATHTLESFLQRDASLHQQVLKIQLQLPVLQSTVNDDKLKEMVNNNFNKVNKDFTYYMVKHPEKENVAAIAHHQVKNKIIKANPRSVLKSSYLFYDQKKENEKPPVQKLEKKIIKNKEAMQARVFHNFIAKTTILHAPIRQQRLPRKQTIKPVERADEEIIVQEVVVSSNGFIETTEDGVVKSKVPLKPTEIVQLSDSDDDYDPKKEHRRKKKQKKRKWKVPEIVISDSEEEVSDENVVQIDLSDSEDDKESSEMEMKTSKRSLRKSSVVSTGSIKLDEQETNSDPSQSTGIEGDTEFKKKRGRPPKRHNSATDQSSGTSGSTSSSKRQRRNTKDSLDSNESSENRSEEQASTVESEFQNIKTKWKCGKCPKTFPSQGSLKTHMQYHNFHEPNSRNLRQITHKPEDDSFKKPESTSVPAKNKYECSRCGETFKNSFLLSRHVKAHESGSKSIECSICKKLFENRAQLINHKRTHIKEQMFKSTTLPKHSPKTTKSLKSPKKLDRFKCNNCTTVFTSLQLLNTHSRSHKRYACSTCTASFISKLALEDHIRHNCVKQSKSPGRRLSLKTRKSFLAPPQRVSKRISLRKSAGKSGVISAPKATSSSSDKERKKLSVVSLASLPCDSCTMVFATHKALFSHKVVKHGLNTPDKSIQTKLKRKTIHKEPHGSVPAGEKLRSAFAGIRTKLDK